MFKKGVAGGGGAAAAFCARSGDDNDMQMPGMIRILDGILEEQPSQPTLTTLRQILNEYKTNPSIPTLKSGLKDQLLIGDALNRVLIVLNDLFGIPSNKERDGALKADCIPVFRSILNALMDDLPLHTYIKMLIQIIMKSYYNDSSIRVAFGAAFVGSTLYVSWVTALIPISSAGGEVAGYVMSVCNTIMNAATDPIQLQNFLTTFLSQEQAMGYANNIVEQAASFITFLRGQLTNPSNILFICALTYTYFMEKLYPAQNFQPLAELRQAAAAPGAPGAPGAAPPGAAAAAVFGAAGAAAPAPVPQDPLFQQMFQPIQQGGVMISNTAKSYLLRLADRIRKICYVMPGVVVPPHETLQATSINFMLSISNYFIEHAERQAERTGMDNSIINATIILKSIFDTESLLNETPTRVAGIIYTLAFSIRNRVIENLVRTGVTRDARDARDAATDLLERKCPVFRSRLTADVLSDHSLSVCVTGRLQWLLDNTSPSEGFNSLSVAVGSLSQSEDERMSQADELLRICYTSGADKYFTPQEINTFRARGINFSLFTSVQKVFSIGIQSVVNCATKLGVIPFTQGIGTQLVELLTPPVRPLSLINAALPIASVLTNPFFPQITQISDMIRDGITQRKTPAAIHDEIMNRFEAKTEEEKEKVREFIRHLLLLCDLQAKFRFHEMNTASGFIVDSDGKPSLGLVLNRETTPFSDNFIRKFTKIVEPKASVSASGASGSAPVSASAPEPVVSGVFVQLQQEIKPMVCDEAATSSASKEQKEATAATAAAIIDCGIELTQLIGPKLSQPDESSAAAAVSVTEESVKEVKEVNTVIQKMLVRLDQNVDVGGMLLEAALNQEENELAAGQSGDSVFSMVSIDEADADPMGNNYKQLELQRREPREPREPRERERRGERPGEQGERSRSNTPLGVRLPDPDSGGSSRRKSRKNAKKTTRRNKKNVRKSSKNTKQQRGRSSRRHRSSRKSRK